MNNNLENKNLENKNLENSMQKTKLGELHSFAARQSIVDKDNNICAYELFFRDSLVNTFPNIDADTATVKLIKSTLESKVSKSFTKQKPAFVNFTLATLKKGYPLQLPKEHIIVEILETEEPTAELLDICKNLHSKGYQIALDDFIHHQLWHNFFPYIDIIKVDFRQTCLSEIVELIEHLTEYPHIRLLAEKIESIEEFEQAINLGFEFFQGYFFDKPEVVKPAAVKTSNLDLAFS